MTVHEFKRLRNLHVSVTTLTVSGPPVEALVDSETSCLMHHLERSR